VYFIEPSSQPSRPSSLSLHLFSSHFHHRNHLLGSLSLPSRINISFLSWWDSLSPHEPFATHCPSLFHFCRNSISGSQIPRQCKERFIDDISNVVTLHFCLIWNSRFWWLVGVFLFWRNTSYFQTSFYIDSGKSTFWNILCW